MTMGKPVLVAYASRHGSTAEVAREIGRGLEARGLAVEVRPLEGVQGLAGYGAVVLGAPLYRGRWLPAAQRFLASHQGELAGLPMAWFVTWLPMGRTHTAHEALCRLDEVAERLQPLSPERIGVFRGALLPGEFPAPLRRLLSWRRAPWGDHLEREEIRRWVDGLDLARLAPPPEPVAAGPEGASPA